MEAVRTSETSVHFSETTVLYLQNLVTFLAKFHSSDSGRLLENGLFPLNSEVMCSDKAEMPTCPLFWILRIHNGVNRSLPTNRRKRL
jgi:hypothetical protein